MKQKNICVIEDIYNVQLINDFLDQYFQDFDAKYTFDKISFNGYYFNDCEKNITFEKLHGDIILIIQSLQIFCLEVFLLKVQRALSTGKKIIIVITYLCYLRQGKDLKEKLGEMILKSLLNYENIIKIFVIDPHIKLNLNSEKYEEITSYDLFFDAIERNVYTLEDCCILSPDKMSAKKNKLIANEFKIDNIIFDKKRDKYGKLKSSEIKNYKYHRYAIVVDDILDTGNTILNAINIYTEMNKQNKLNTSFIVYCTHGVLSTINENLINNKNIMSINVTSSYINPIMQEKYKNMKSFTDFMELCTYNTICENIKVFDISHTIYNFVKKALDNS